MQQWVDLARLTGLQSTEDEGPPPLSVLEGQEAKVEDSLEANTSTCEQPPLTLENLDLENLTLDQITLEKTDVLKHEAEPTRLP